MKEIAVRLPVEDREILLQIEDITDEGAKPKIINSLVIVKREHQKPAQSLLSKLSNIDGQKASEILNEFHSCLSEVQGLWQIGALRDEKWDASEMEKAIEVQVAESKGGMIEFHKIGTVAEMDVDSGAKPNAKSRKTETKINRSDEPDVNLLLKKKTVGKKHDAPSGSKLTSEKQAPVH